MMCAAVGRWREGRHDAGPQRVDGWAGAAQGLFLALFTAQSYAAFKLLPQPDSQAFYGWGSLLALALLALGLGASFFHLGHPERAWRTATKWRTSWLSREVIVLPAFMGVVFLYGLAHWLDRHQRRLNLLYVPAEKIRRFLTRFHSLGHAASLLSQENSSSTVSAQVSKIRLKTVAA